MKLLSLVFFIVLGTAGLAEANGDLTCIKDRSGKFVLRIQGPGNPRNGAAAFVTLEAAQEFGGWAWRIDETSHSVTYDIAGNLPQGSRLLVFWTTGKDGGAVHVGARLFLSDQVEDLSCM